MKIEQFSPKLAQISQFFRLTAPGLSDKCNTLKQPDRPDRFNSINNIENKSDKKSVEKERIYQPEGYSYSR